MGFSDPVVGGIGTLIRDYIQSEGFVTGVTGWTINKDGSAEFNNATFRGTIIITAAGQAMLVYSGAPALGNLVLAISALPGFDTFGNHFEAGLTIVALTGVGSATVAFDPNDPALTNPAIYGATLRNGGAANAYGIANVLAPFNQTGVQQPSGIEIEGMSADATRGAQIRFYLGAVAIRKEVMRLSDLISILTSALQITGDLTVTGNTVATGDVTQSGGDVQVGAGYPGAYYFEQVGMPAQVVPNSAGVTTVLINLVANVLKSDYGSAFNLATGVWTCPVDGVYTFNLYPPFQAFVAGSRYIAAIRLGTGAFIARYDSTISAAGNPAGASVTACIAMVAGDTADFRVSQQSGVNQTISLGTAYISVRREL